MSPKRHKSAMFIIMAGDIKTITGIRVNFDQQKIREKRDSSSEIKHASRESHSRKRSSENISRLRHSSP